MGDTQELKNNQRVTNAKIYAKLESMDTRLQQVEATSAVTAEHAIRCGERQNQYERDRSANEDEHDKLEKGLADLRKDSKLYSVISGAIVAGLGAIGIVIKQ
jgi:hypothetical protein